MDDRKLVVEDGITRCNAAVQRVFNSQVLENNGSWPDW
jgi:hypothetical protein